MVVEAAQVAGFGQDGERQDRADVWQLLETPEVGVVPSCGMQLVLPTDRAADRGESSPSTTRNIATASEFSATGIPIDDCAVR